MPLVQQFEPASLEFHKYLGIFLFQARNKRQIVFCKKKKNNNNVYTSNRNISDDAFRTNLM